MTEELWRRKRKSKQKQLERDIGNLIPVENIEFNNKFYAYGDSNLLSIEVMEAVVSLFNNVDSEVSLTLTNNQLTVSLPQNIELLSPKLRVKITEESMLQKQDKLISILDLLVKMNLNFEKGHSVGA